MLKPFHSIVFIILAGVCLAAEPVRVIDLLTVGTPAGEITRVHGSTGRGNRGVPVCGGFDCDGDGHIDVGFAGIRSEPLGRSGAGEVTFVFGDSTIGGAIDTTGFSSNWLKIAGAQVDEVCGDEIWMDDITGDGLGDLIIGRQNFTPAAGREGAGALTILAGGSELRAAATNLQYLDLAAVPASVTNLTFVGDRECDRLGIWMRTGDITGDGIADLVVGSDQYDGPLTNENARGVLYVIRGGPHLATNAIIDLQDFGSTSMTGHIARVHPPAGSAGYHMGATCQVGDLDGNGRAEVLAAASLLRAGAALPIGGLCPNSSGGSARGTLYIAWDDNFTGNPWPAGYQFQIDTSPGSHTIIEGDTVNDNFAEEILGGEDYSGDGRPDLFLGDLSGDGINGNNSGVGHLFYDSGSLRGMVFSMVTPPPGLEFTVMEGPILGAIGADTVAHGDFDQDGITDLAFGNPHDAPQGRGHAGSVHVFYGEPGGWPAVINTALNQLPDPSLMRIVRIEGARGTINADIGDNLCYSAAAGDIDADGHPDLLVNEMVGNGINTNDVGNLLIISGKALLPPPIRITDAAMISFDDTRARLTFPTTNGGNYFVQSADSPAHAWTNVVTGISGVPGFITVTNPLPENGGLYYRVGQD